MTNFTNEQFEAAKAAKSPEELIKTRAVELSEEDMNSVAGGVRSGSDSTYQEMAAAEERTIHVPIGEGFWFCEVDSQLCSCADRGISVYAKSTSVLPTGIGYVDSKCYQCNKSWRLIGGIA